MLTRTLLLYGLVAIVTAAAVLVMVPLPEIPLLRYVLYAMPLIGAFGIAVEVGTKTAPP